MQGGKDEIGVWRREQDRVWVDPGSCVSGASSHGGWVGTARTRAKDVTGPVTPGTVVEVV